MVIILILHRAPNNKFIDRLLRKLRLIMQKLIKKGKREQRNALNRLKIMKI